MDDEQEMNEEQDRAWRRLYAALALGRWGGGEPDQVGHIIAEALRSDIPLNEMMRRELADLIDPDGDTTCQLKLVQRHKGRPPHTLLEMMKRRSQKLAAMKTYDDAKAAGHPAEAAVQQAMQETGLTRSEVYEAKRERGEALKRLPEERLKFRQSKVQE
mgnify:CR=1 FL=1